MFFQVGEEAEASSLVLADPAIGNLVNGYGVEVVQFFAAAAERSDKAGFFQNAQVFRNSLARHLEILAEIAQGLSVFRVKAIEQEAAAGVGQRFEYPIVMHSSIMQP
jgi:hypothetical protein